MPPEIRLASESRSPKPGKQQGDEAAPTVEALLGLKRSAPGLRGVIVDTVLRGVHIATLARAGLVTVNHPPAAENPNRKKQGRKSKKRVERTQFLRIHRHTLPNGQDCEHRLHTVGSVPHQERLDDEGNLVLVPLPNAVNGYARKNADGTHRWYVVYDVPCPHGHSTASLRIDAPGLDDAQGWSHADLMRFYPVGTPQFGLLYGQRNASESVNNQYKHKATRVPAYGVIRQTLFVIGYIATHNAVARAFHLRRAGKPNALDNAFPT